MLRLSNVRKIFNAGKPNEWVALDGVNLVVEPGKITALTGPSGSGKTTLLTLMGCMARPTSGRIWLDGQEMTSLPERFLTQIRRESFGFIFQQCNLIKGLTTLDNVMLPAYSTHLSEEQVKAEGIKEFAMKPLTITGIATLLRKVLDDKFPAHQDKIIQ